MILHAANDRRGSDGAYDFARGGCAVDVGAATVPVLVHRRAHSSRIRVTGMTRPVESAGRQDTRELLRAIPWAVNRRPAPVVHLLALAGARIRARNAPVGAAPQNCLRTVLDTSRNVRRPCAVVPMPVVRVLGRASVVVILAGSSAIRRGLARVGSDVCGVSAGVDRSDSARRGYRLGRAGHSRSSAARSPCSGRGPVRADARRVSASVRLAGLGAHLGAHASAGDLSTRHAGAIGAGRRPRGRCVWVRRARPREHSDEQPAYLFHAEYDTIGLMREQARTPLART